MSDLRERDNGGNRLFHRGETASIRLRRLFEQRGFRRIRVGKFEDYGLYVENKNFLQSEQIITFMNMDGRLLALKPDMTLSVVKNIPAGELPAFQKLYYVDEVYRASKEHREYRALNQIGVELVGQLDTVACLEVVDLALQALARIDEHYVLDVSHLGFVAGLLADLKLPVGVEARVLEAIHKKSLHDLRQLVETAGAGEQAVRDLLVLAELHGDFREGLSAAKPLIRNREMQEAWDELSSVAAAVGTNGHARHANLDFSVVNDLDYYNGLLFRGYVEGVPLAVLRGGRYDNLLRRMGKESGAIGFGILLDELQIRSGPRQPDFDLLIRYDAGCDGGALLHCVNGLVEQGRRVRLERRDADLSAAEFTWERAALFAGDALTEEGGRALC